MPRILPFRALRFAEAEIPQVVAPPYDVVSSEERVSLAARSEHNVVHVDLPEGDGDAKYAHAASLLQKWRAEGVLTAGPEPVLLSYRQTFEPPGGGAEMVRRGFFALVRLGPYDAKQVLPHERTLSGPKEDRLKLFHATATNISPVFMLYRDPDFGVDSALERAEVKMVSFETPDGIEHELGRIEDAGAIERAVQVLAKGPALIADGHHRYETSLSYERAIDEARVAAGKPVASERASHRWVLAYLSNLEDPGLLVLPTHRLVHSVQIDAPRLSERAAPLFNQWSSQVHDLPALLRQLSEGQTRAPTFAAVFPDGNALILSLRQDVNPKDIPGLRDRPQALWGCDVAILHGAILEGILGITTAAQTAQSNLVYVKDVREAIRRILAKEGSVLFLLNGTPVRQVRDVAVAGEVMPQKSTYFYPKVPTGLALHVLDPEVED
jgi:uncharacterized protein (DUF1015 family)